MNNFHTPVKEVSYKYGVSPFQRQGDWVCNYCNNLNFAFRKKCNRCKMQTREQNEKYIPYYYQYQCFYPRQVQPLQSISTNQDPIHSTPPRKRKDKENSSLPKHFSTTLPSVSPLVKKYRTVQQEKEKVHSDKQCSETRDQDGYRILLGEQCWEKQFQGFCYEQTPKQASKQLQEQELDNQDIEKMMKNILV